MRTLLQSVGQRPYLVAFLVFGGMLAYGAVRLVAMLETMR